MYKRTVFFFDNWYYVTSKWSFNSIQDRLFRGCSRMAGVGQKGPPLPTICHTYPVMMKLGTVIPYLKEISVISESRCAPLRVSHRCWEHVGELFKIWWGELLELIHGRGVESMGGEVGLKRCWKIPVKEFIC